MQLKLIVIRTGDMPGLAAFYTLFGFTFEYHKHGNSPYHYSAKIDETVIEIYPLAKGQITADSNLRIGFTVDNFDEVVKLLKENISSAPTQTNWGFMAIVKDPDGRTIEIYKE